MGNRVFRFYSTAPEGLFALVGERWGNGLVRRDGWKIGASPVFYVAVVFDNDDTAEDFSIWLAVNVKLSDIRKFIRRPGFAGADVYNGVLFHNPGQIRPGCTYGRLRAWRDLLSNTVLNAKRGFRPF